MNLSIFRYIGKLSMQKNVGMKYQHQLSRKSHDLYKKRKSLGIVLTDQCSLPSGIHSARDAQYYGAEVPTNSNISLKKYDILESVAYTCNGKKWVFPNQTIVV